MSRKVKGLILFGVVAALLIGGFWAWRSRRAPLAGGEEFRYAGLKSVAAYLSLIENPSARRVYVADEASEAYAAILERAGLVTLTAQEATGLFDIVWATGPKTSEFWEQQKSRLAPQGLFVWGLDVRQTSAATLKEWLASFPCVETHLWMPGEHDWLLVGRQQAASVKMDEALDVFTREELFQDLAEAGCDTLAEMFASYVGTLDEIEAAFAGDLTTEVQPEHFVTREIPATPWLVPGEMEGDIYTNVMHEIRSMQVVRRSIIEAGLMTRRPEGISAAAEKWAAAYLRNPHDPFLRERLYTLALNARVFEKVGNFKGAANCYELMIVIAPRDAAAIMAYANCLNLMGKKELARQVYERAIEVKRRADARPER